MNAHDLLVLYNTTMKSMEFSNWSGENREVRERALHATYSYLRDIKINPVNDKEGVL